MKTKIMLAIMGMALVVSASAASEFTFLRPLFTEADRVSDPQLAGSWIESDGDNDDPIVIRELGDGDYAVENQLFGPFGLRGHLVRLGAFRFLDLMPMKAVVEPGSYSLLPVPHVTKAGDVFLTLLPDEREGAAKNTRVEILPWRIVCRVHVEGDVLHVACAMDGDWQDEAVARGELTVEHQVAINSTEELRKFVLRHAEDDRMFSYKLDLHRHKAAPPETGKP